MGLVVNLKRAIDLRYSCVLALLLLQACGPTAKPPTATPVKTASTTQDLRAFGPMKWQAALDAQDVDLVQFIHKDRVLAGATTQPESPDLLRVPGLSAASIRPRVAETLALFEASTGRRLWQIRRETLGDLPQSVMTTDPLLLIRAGAPNKGFKFSALDPSTGAIVWSLALGPGSHGLPLESGNTLLLTEPGKGSVQVRAIDMTNGKDRWSTRIAGNAKTAPVQVIGEHVFVAMDQMHGLQLKTGAEFWQRALLPSPAAPRAVIANAGNQVLVGSGGVLTWIDKARSAPVAGRALAGKELKFLWVDGDTIFAVSSSLTVNGSTVLGLRLDGQSKWSYTAPEALRSGLLVDGSRVFFTTPGQFICLDRTNGSVLYRRDFPKGLKAYDLLPDILVSAPNGSVRVARETGVAEFAANDGRELFASCIDGGERYTSRFLQARYSEMVRTAIPVNRDRPPFDAALKMVVSDAQYRQAQAFQVYAAQLGKLGSTSDRAASAVASAQAQTQSELMAAEVEYAMLGASGKDSASGMDPKLQSLADGIRRDAANASAEAAVTHVRSLSGRYYVRPFFQKGFKLAIIDLEARKRCDVFLVPPDDAFEDRQCLNQMPFALESGSGLIVAKSGRPVPGQKTFAFRRVRGNEEKSVETQLPCFSLVACSPSALNFERANPMAESVSVALSAADQTLLDAAYGGNATEIDKAIQAGARVNVADRFGRTPIMYAAYSLDVDAMKAILKARPDLRAKDTAGWTVWDFLGHPTRTTLQDKYNATQLRGLLADYARKG